MGSHAIAAERVDDAVAVEEPLEIRVAGETLAITMRTPGGPGDDERLVLGFLFAEGLIARAGDLTRVIHCGREGTPEARNVIDALPAGGVRIDLEKSAPSRRGTLTTSACGICGRTSIDDVLERLPARQNVNVTSHSLSFEPLFDAIAALEDRQPVFARTGGLHCALLRDASGTLSSAEDVGRHNAVDKAIGALLAKGSIPAAPGAAPRILAVSGRASFEIVQKAAMAGLAAVASVSVPSSLAIDLAERAGIVLAGFVRGDRMNVYAGAERVSR